MNRYLFFLSLIFFMACGDDTSTLNNNNVVNNSTLTNNTTHSGRKLGENCSINSQCTSKICLSGICSSIANGPECGKVFCRANETCDNASTSTCKSKNCSADDLACQCEKNSKSWCLSDSGGTCCEIGDACLFQQCVTPGKDCDPEVTDSCPIDEFCEPTANKCFRKDISPNACTYRPPIGKFDPVEAYAWTGSTVSPNFDQVMMTPMVANLTDDNGDGKTNEDDIPDIVFTTFWNDPSTGSYGGRGVLRVISGDDATEHWSSTGLTVPFEVKAAATPALGDINSDGTPEIIIEAATGGVYAISNEGIILWHNKQATGNSSGGPTITNLDGKGNPEIITGRNILSSTGATICTYQTYATLPVAVDLDNDGLPEIIVGKTAYKLIDVTKTDGTGCALFSVSAEGFSQYTAIADFDNNGTPEIVGVVGGNLYIHDNQFNTILSKRLPIDKPRIKSLYKTDCLPGAACTSSSTCRAVNTSDRCNDGHCMHWACLPGGGPPTVADFDGDGVPEIGVAGRWYYLVYEANGDVLWAHKTKDFSSAVTGSSVFDFEGDGKAEVVYNDEAFLRVYSGTGSGKDEDGDGFNDPEILLEEINTSGTLFEYPIIVDVDNDGSAEIVVSANDYAFTGTKGIRIFKDAQNRWVGTRKIWNQHSYHVTNVNEDGSIPLKETPNWTDPYLNNYRQNVQGGNLDFAPNFTVEAEIDGKRCAAVGLLITFKIKNTGAIGVRAGALSTTLYGGISGRTLTKIETTLNTRPLPPGAFEDVEYMWTVPDSFYGKDVEIKIITDSDENGNGRHNECIESDNETKRTTECVIPQ